MNNKIKRLRSYYGMQLRKRLYREHPRLVGWHLRTQVLLRKSYVVKRFFKRARLRRSLSNIGAYISVQFHMRDTQIFIGVPCHTFACYFKPRYRVFD